MPDKPPQPVAHLEFICGIVRVFPPGGCYGRSPLEFSAFVTRIDDDTCKISGAMSCPSPSQFRALVAELTRLGFRRATWERRNTGRLRVITYTPRLKDDHANP